MGFFGNRLQHRRSLFRSRLHLAALNGHPDVLQVLLEHGARCDVATATGKTPLHGAALYGHGSVVRMLLEFKADKELDGWGMVFWWGENPVRKAIMGNIIHYLCNVYTYTYVCIHTCTRTHTHNHIHTCVQHILYDTT